MGDASDKTRFNGAQFTVSTRGATVVLDAKLLLSALLVFAAQGDGKITATETDHVLSLLNKNLDNADAQVIDVANAFVRSLAASNNLLERLRKICLGLSNIECSEVFAASLTFVAKNGSSDKDNVHTATTAGTILGLSQDAIATGMQAAQRQKA